MSADFHDSKRAAVGCAAFGCGYRTGMRVVAIARYESAPPAGRAQCPEADAEASG
jgi:hypothetical protein